MVGKTQTTARDLTGRCPLLLGAKINVSAVTFLPGVLFLIAANASAMSSFQRKRPPL
jgi:hypothetical protein